MGTHVSSQVLTKVHNIYNNSRTVTGVLGDTGVPSSFTSCFSCAVGLRSAGKVSALAMRSASVSTFCWSTWNGKLDRRNQEDIKLYFEKPNKQFPRTSRLCFKKKLHPSLVDYEPRLNSAVRLPTYHRDEGSDQWPARHSLKTHNSTFYFGEVLQRWPWSIPQCPIYVSTWASKKTEHMYTWTHSRINAKSIR